jgi:tRNA pseudouridine13 synthase
MSSEAAQEAPQRRPRSNDAGADDSAVQPATRGVDRTNGCGLTLIDALARAAVTASDAGDAAHASSTLSPAPARFFGVLKERFSDFVVRELNPRPLVLRSLEVPPECAAVKHDNPPQRATPADGGGAASTSAPPPATPFARAQALVTASAGDAAGQESSAQQNAPSVIERVSELLDAALAGGTTPSPLAQVDVTALAAAIASGAVEVTLPTPTTDKQHRGRVHEAARRLGFPESTTAADGRIVVILRRGPGTTGRGFFRGATGGPAGDGGGRPPPPPRWPVGRGDHLHFTLYKENIESGAALRQLAAKLAVPLRDLQYCGNKDKRAVTLQRVSCYRLPAESVARLNGMTYGRSSIVRLGDFEYRAAPLQLGRLAGNAFCIVLRRVSADAVTPDTLRVFEHSLRTHGCANYFGPQRFGTTSVPTSDVGLALLRGDFHTTLRLVLRSKLDFCPDMAPALEAFERGDFEAAAGAVPYHCSGERDVLRALREQPKDLLRAVLVLPRPLTMLFCHSVQSLVWNTMVAERLRVAPRVLVGDLVRASTAAAAMGAAAATAAAAAENDDVPLEVDIADDLELAAVAGTAAGGGPVAGAAAAAVDSSAPSGPLPRVHVVTADDVAARRFSLADVLLPVPGPDPDLRFPEHAVSGRAAYVACMTALGIGDALLSVGGFIEKRFHVHGTYRAMVVVPGNASLRLVAYSRHDEQIVATDWQRINASAAATQQRAAQPEDAEKPLRAVVAEFELPAGAYATSVLREMCDSVSDTRTLVDRPPAVAAAPAAAVAATAVAEGASHAE